MFVPPMRPQLATLILNHAIDQLKPGESRTLASGKVITYPNYYADMRLLTTLPQALAILAEAILRELPESTRYIGAVPTGGLTMLGAVGCVLGDLITNTPLKQARLFYVRKEKKGHGQGK